MVNHSNNSNKYNNRWQYLRTFKFHLNDLKNAPNILDLIRPSPKFRIISRQKVLRHH